VVTDVWGIGDGVQATGAVEAITAPEASGKVKGSGLRLIVVWS
jgi:hypothetical protein